MFLKIQEAESYLTFRPDDVALSKGYEIFDKNYLPSFNFISEDAEKALIKVLQLSYNKVFYKNYPKGKGSLFAYGFDEYSYQIFSPLLLLYKEGEIRGRPDTHADALVINEGKALKIIKNPKYWPICSDHK